MINLLKNYAGQKKSELAFPQDIVSSWGREQQEVGSLMHTPSTRSSGFCGTAACFFWLRALWEVMDSLRVFIINPESVVTPEPDTEKYIVHRSSSAILAQWQKANQQSAGQGLSLSWWAQWWLLVKRVILTICFRWVCSYSMQIIPLWDWFYYKIPVK